MIETIRDHLVNSEAMLRGVLKVEQQRESDDQLMGPTAGRVGRVLRTVQRARRDLDYWFMPSDGWELRDIIEHERPPWEEGPSGS